MNIETEDIVMTIGEKIKYFRNMRNISQETLGQLAGINSATIKKYEYGIRNPKPDQLLKITNALGISINLFMDFDIETASDVLSLLFKMDEQIDMIIDGEKDENGNIEPQTLFIRFKHPEINKRLAQFAKTKKAQENLIASERDFPSKAIFQQELEQMNTTFDEIKQHLVDTNMMVRKGTHRISVKMYPETDL